MKNGCSTTLLINENNKKFLIVDPMLLLCIFIPDFSGVLFLK
jgi:hypothetical protein